MSTPRYPTVIVCGGDDCRYVWHVFRVLDAWLTHAGGERVIQSGTRGVPQLARQWAFTRDIPCQKVPADHMLTLNPDAVIAFPGGQDTATIIKSAHAANVPVITFERFAI